MKEFPSCGVRASRGLTERLSGCNESKRVKASFNRVVRRLVRPRASAPRSGGGFLINRGKTFCLYVDGVLCDAVARGATPPNPLKKARATRVFPRSNGGGRGRRVAPPYSRFTVSAVKLTLALSRVKIRIHEGRPYLPPCRLSLPLETLKFDRWRLSLVFVIKETWKKRQEKRKKKKEKKAIQAISREHESRAARI